jgi:hypothetical protein
MSQELLSLSQLQKQVFVPVLRSQGLMILSHGVAWTTVERGALLLRFVPIHRPSRTFKVEWSRLVPDADNDFLELLQNGAFEASYQGLINWWSIDAPPGVAKFPLQQAAVWDGTAPGCDSELVRVLQGALPVLEQALSELVRSPGTPIRALRNGTIGTFGRPEFGSQWIEQKLARRDIAGVREAVERLGLEHPGNEWVLYWRSRLADIEDEQR